MSVWHPLMRGDDESMAGFFYRVEAMERSGEVDAEWGRSARQVELAEFRRRGFRFLLVGRARDAQMFAWRFGLRSPDWRLVTGAHSVRGYGWPSPVEVVHVDSLDVRLPDEAWWHLHRLEHESGELKRKAWRAAA